MTARSRTMVALVVLAAALAAAAVVALLAWRRGEATRGGEAKVQSRAGAHLAAGCELLVRVDVRRALLVAEVKKHLEPALADLGPPDGGPRRVLRAAGIDPARDVGEISVCFAGQPGKPRLAFVFAGDFRPGAVVPAILQAETSSPPEVSQLEGRPLARKREPNGESTFVTQAADGAIVIANDEALLASAVASSDRASTYGLEAGREVAFAVGPAMFELIGARSTPGLETLAAARAATGSVGLGDRRATIRVRAPEASRAEALAAEVKHVIAEALGRWGGQARLAELAGLGAATVEPHGDQVVIEAQIPAAGIEALAELLQRQLRDATAAPGAAVPR